MATATIKIDTDLRDRIKDAAKERGISAGAFVEELFEVWLRDQRHRAVREAMTASSPENRAYYRQQTSSFDQLAAEALAQSFPAADEVGGETS